MKEIKGIIRKWKGTDTTTKAALATVVHVAGSSYRREGARMLITDDGHWTGGISGGCLEGDALRKAQQAIFRQEPRVVTYNTLDDDPFQIGANLGCKGLIRVLLEPLGAADEWNPVNLLEQAVQSNAPAVLFIVTEGEGPIGTSGIYLENGGYSGKKMPVPASELEALAKEVLTAGSSVSRSFPGGVEIFAELLLPPIHLIVFGNNYDVLPLLQLAAVLDWQLDAVGKVSAFHPDVFRLASVGTEMPDIPNPGRTAVVLMAHDFKTDKANLLKVLDTDVPFIGLLGPKKRKERMLSELEAEGRSLSRQDLDRIHGPAGLDIGANTPDTIALSILAEIQAFFGNRSGGHLRDREGPIYGA
ncbi:MAG: XdhC family protein [Saprospiraceae bacterium]